MLAKIFDPEGRPVTNCPFIPDSGGSFSGVGRRTFLKSTVAGAFIGGPVSFDYGQRPASPVAFQSIIVRGIASLVRGLWKGAKFAATTGSAALISSELGPSEVTQIDNTVNTVYNNHFDNRRNLVGLSVLVLPERNYVTNFRFRVFDPSAAEVKNGTVAFRPPYRREYFVLSLEDPRTDIYLPRYELSTRPEAGDYFHVWDSTGVQLS